MPMFTVTFLTLPVNADGSADESRKEGEQIAFSQGDTQQDAEDNARVWLSGLSDAARVYTKAGKARRKLGPVRANHAERLADVADITAGSFVIYREHAAQLEG